MAAATWKEQTNFSPPLTGDSHPLHKVAFVNACSGVTVGRGGSIRTTTDGGTLWTQRYSGTKVTLRDVAAISPNHAWAVGDNHIEGGPSMGKGTIVSTDNGGVTFTAQDSGNSNNLFGVSFADSKNGWVVGDKGTILRTKNGGGNWDDITQNNPDRGHDLGDVVFVDAMNGWAVGAGGTILHTTDGGDSWELQKSSLPVATAPPLLAVAFPDLMTGYAVGFEGTILATKDGGKLWEFQPSVTFEPNSGTLHDVAFVDTMRGWVVGFTDIILATTDGGDTWTEEKHPSGPQDNISGVAFPDAGNGYAVSSRILKFSVS